MGASQIQAGKAYVAIYGDTKPLVQEIKKLAPEIRKQGDELAKIGESTASAFKKGTAEILNATEGTKATALAMNIAAASSNAFGAASTRALESTAASSRSTASATQQIVEQMSKATPATRGFATAFGALKSADVSLSGGAFGIKGVIQLLQGAGSAAKPLTEGLKGVVGETQKIKEGLLHDYGLLSSFLKLSLTPIKIGAGITNAALGVDSGIGRNSLLQKVARQAQQGSALFGTKEQKATAKQMGQEADAAAIGAAFARGWVPGFYKVAQLELPRALFGITKGIVLSPISLGKGLAQFVTGTRQAGTEATTTSSKLSSLHDAIQKVRMVASGQGMLSVGRGLGIGAMLAGSMAAMGGISRLAGHHNGEATSRIQSVGLSASRNKRSVEVTSALDFAARSTGTSLKTLDAGFDHLSEVMNKAKDGNESSIKAFNAIGISAEALSKLSLDEKMQRVGDALSQVKDPIERDRRAMDLLGDSGHELVAMLTGGMDYLKQYGKVADDAATKAAAGAAKIKKSAASASAKPLMTGRGYLENASDEIKGVLATKRAKEDATSNEVKLAVTAQRARDAASSAASKKSINQVLATKRAADAESAAHGRSMVNAAVASKAAGRSQIAKPATGDRFPVKQKSDAKSAGGSGMKIPESAIITAKDVEAAKAMSQAMSTLRALTTNAWNQIGAASIRSTTQWVGGAAKFLERNQQVVGSLLKLVAGIGAVAGGIVLWSQFGGPVITIVQAIGSSIALLMSPIGLVVAGIAAGTAAWMYFTESGQANAKYLSDGLGQFFSAFSEAWSGIVSAVGSGNLALAGDIAWESLKLGFLQTINSMGVSWSAVMEILYGASRIVTDGVSNGWAVVATAFRTVQNEIAKGMIALTGGVAKLWAQVFAGMVKGFNNTHNVIGKGILYLYGKATGRSDEDMKSDSEGMDQQTSHLNSQAEAQRQSALGPELVGQMNELDKMAAADVAKIEAARAQAIAAHEQLLADRMATLSPDDKRIADTKSRLDDLKKKASEEAVANKIKPTDIHADNTQLSAHEGSVAGSFNAAAAAGMGGGGAVDRIAKATEMTARGVAGLAKMAEKDKVAQAKFKAAHPKFGSGQP